MESIKELRVKLQTNVLGHPILQRVPSIYLTRLFLLTKVTANQVSVAMIVVGAASGAALALGFVWTGFLLLYAGILLDAVDGEIARYRRTFSLPGVYLDLVNHVAVHAIFFLGLTLWVSEARTAANMPVLICGALGALAMSMRRANGDLHRVLFVRPYSEHPAAFSLHALPEKKSQTAQKESARPLRSVIRFLKEGLYDLHESAYMLIVIAGAYAIEQLVFPGVPHFPLLSWVVVFFGITSCLYLIKEVIGNFRSVETKVAAIDARLKSRFPQ